MQLKMIIFNVFSDKLKTWKVKIRKLSTYKVINISTKLIKEEKYILIYNAAPCVICVIFSGYIDL